MVPCIKGADGTRLRRLPHLLRGPDHQDAREQAHRRRLQGHQHLADQPGRARHDRLGAAADERPGDDHRHRLDRLPARVGARDARPDQAARRLEGDDDDLDLRPPDHPGRRVGLLPAPDRAAAAGRGLASTRASPSDLGVDRRRSLDRAPTRPPPRRRRSAPPPRRRRSPPSAERGAPAGGPGRDLAAQGLPHPRPPRGAPRPARLGAEGRSGDPAREPQPDARADVADPGVDPAHRRSRARPCSTRCRGCARPTAARSATSSSTSPRTSSASGCAR